MTGASAVNARLVAATDTRKNGGGQNTNVSVRNIVRAATGAALQGPFDSLAVARAWVTTRNGMVLSLSVSALDARGVAKELYVEVP